MSNTESWALNNLRYSEVPELQRRVRNLEEDARVMREQLADLVERLRHLEEGEEP